MCSSPAQCLQHISGSSSPLPSSPLLSATHLLSHLHLHLHLLAMIEGERSHIIEWLLCYPHGMRVDEDEMRMGGSEAVERSQNNINIWTPYRPHKRPLGGVSRSPANFVLFSGRNPMKQRLYIFCITMLCTRSSHACIISYLYQDRIGEICLSSRGEFSRL